MHAGLAGCACQQSYRAAAVYSRHVKCASQHAAGHSHHLEGRRRHRAFNSGGARRIDRLDVAALGELLPATIASLGRELCVGHAVADKQEDDERF